MSKITLLAPAKINLGLEILRKREDGYHDIKTIYVSVSLFDELEIEESKEIKIVCDDEAVPVNENNSVYKALKLLRKKARIYIKKNIPVKAGLGGGSSDAAAVLKEFGPTSPRQPAGLRGASGLMDLALEVGSDVPYQIIGGTKLGCGRGEILSDLPSLSGINLVICVPEVGVETKWAYQNVDYTKIGPTSLKLPSAALGTGRGAGIDKLIAAIKKLDIFEIAKNLHNDFEYWVLPKFPEILKVKNDVVKYGALGALMTGSGSGVFGICEDERSARGVYEEMRKMYKKVFLVKII